LISERVLLAFDTGRGLAYVQTSGWQRTYLLWTFRNFRGVPHKILNARQRELVESLYSASSTSLSCHPDAYHPDEAALIGTIEDFSPATPVAVPFTVAYDDAAPGAPRTKADTLSPSLCEQLYAINNHRITPGLARTLGAWALVVTMAVLSWQQLRSRPVVSASTPQAAPALQASAGDRLSQDQENVDAAINQATAPALPKAHEQLAVMASTAGAAPITPSVPAVTAETTAKQRLGNVKRDERDANTRGVIQVAGSVPRISASLTSGRDSSASLPRIRISGPPRKLVYPVCPDGITRGKVSLQAVVGYDGTVSQVKVIAGNRLLAAAAARAIREWRYQPFSADAQKIERETRITISFIADDVVAVSFPDDGQVSR
jgi:outer membrane biosynthesis protein TonB